MSLNKTNIEWCDYTWNPVTGCLHDCPYCYARKIAKRFKGTKAWPEGFKPTFHKERLKDPLGLGKQYYCPEVWAEGYSIFVCSMADLFGAWVPEWWIEDTLMAMSKTPRHTFLLLTKNPERMEAWSLVMEDYHNIWWGTSVTGKADLERILYLKNTWVENRFVSFEPLLDDPGDDLNLKGIRQIIIGAQTNPDQCAGLESVLKICEEADRAGVKVFMKDSMAGRWPDRELRRELCWSIHKTTERKKI